MPEAHLLAAVRVRPRIHRKSVARIATDASGSRPRWMTWGAGGSRGPTVRNSATLQSLYWSRWHRCRAHAGRAGWRRAEPLRQRSEEHTSELQSRENLVCRLLLEKKKKKIILTACIIVEIQISSCITIAMSMTTPASGGVASLVLHK